MATLTVDRRAGEVVGWNIQWCEGKRRHTIYLSSRTYRRKTVEGFKDLVETLVYYRKNGTIVPDKAVANRLATAPVELQEKLAKAGLINVTKHRTCQELWDTFVKHRTNVEPSTILAYRQIQSVFFEKFSPKMHIEKLTAEDMLDWKAFLIAQEYALTTIASYLRTIKTVLGWAVDQDWLMKNPMAKIPIGRPINRDKDRIITMEEYAKLLDACTSQEWRTILALARIGGLRCPSELKQLRWSDINWSGNRFLVQSPKTKRFEGHKERIVPLFAELRSELERHFALVESEDNEFVLQGHHGRSWQLANTMEKIAIRSGVGKIIRPFDNMRLSRSNEVEREFGPKKESLWIGHSEKVMLKFYLVLEDKDFAEAAGASFGEQNSHAVSHAVLAKEDGRR